MAINPKSLKNLKPCKPWETNNPNWQPRKSFSVVNAELKAKWVTPLTKSQLIEAYTLVFNTEEEELQRIAKDKQYPYWLRLIIMELNNKNTRSKALADYRDYMFWKAIQKQEITWKDWESIKIDTKDINNKKTEDLIEIIQSKLK